MAVNLGQKLMKGVGDKALRELRTMTGEAFKKEIRDRVDNKDLIIDEMGDVLWYLTRLCDVYDIKISELMVNNMDKLFNRMSDEEAKAYRDEH